MGMVSEHKVDGRPWLESGSTSNSNTTNNEQRGGGELLSSDYGVWAPGLSLPTEQQSRDLGLGTSYFETFLHQ